MINKILMICVFLLLSGCSILSKREDNDSEIKTTFVWDKATHSSFTNLETYNKTFYLIFCEGRDHGLSGRSNNTI